MRSAQKYVSHRNGCLENSGRTQGSVASGKLADKSVREVNQIDYSNTMMIRCKLTTINEKYRCLHLNEYLKLIRN